MSWSMRNSKFRHVFGKPLKRDQCYDNIRITRSSWEASYCAVNPKYVAVVTESAGGGSFLVLPLSKTGRVERDGPLVCGHTAAVLDVAWCPHNDDIIASASDDCTVKIWAIPEGGLTANLTEPVVDLYAHQKRVGQVVWHPSANNVLLSTGSDNMMFIWNVGTGEPLVEISLPDLPYCASFNYDGSLLAATCKDKKLRVINPRSGEILQEQQCHMGSKPARCVYLKDGLILTTGFSKMSERQYALWDEKSLKEPINVTEIDKSNGVMFPFYDPDTSMVYLIGKGDTIIRYYEISGREVFFLTIYQAQDPQRGMGFMPKRGLNVNQCEIARVYKLHNSGLCEVIPFTVPRKSDLFQDDLYPDTASDTPAISADEWMSGKNADPVLLSLKEGYKPSKKEGLKVVRKSNILDKMPSRASQSNNEAAAATPALPPQLPKKTLDYLKEGFDPEQLVKDVKELNQLVKKQDRRIEELEKRLAAVEAKAADPQTDEEDVPEETGDQC